MAKTSRICVIFDLFLVVIIAVFSPVSESVAEAGGLLPVLSQSVFRPRTCFVGLGIMSFAFSCQHSSLIIAGSLKNPSRDDGIECLYWRWGLAVRWLSSWVRSDT